MPSSTYSVVPSGAAAADDDDEPCSCVQRYLMGGSLTAEQKVVMASSQPEHQQPLVLRLHSESIRQIAYAFFWSMCILAIVLSKTMIPPQVIEESDLKNVFGYNNVSIANLKFVCANVSFTILSLWYLLTTNFFFVICLEQ